MSDAPQRAPDSLPSVAHRETDLTGKVVIITGASRGVGRRASLDFAARGAHVVLAARTVEPDPKLPGTIGATLGQIERAGGSAVAVETDLSKVEDLEKLVKTAEERFGGVDVLVNNAAVTTGAIWGKPFMELTREEWLYQFDVNLHAPFTLTQLVVPIMEKRGGGRIINVSTGSGEVFRQPEELPKLNAVGNFSLLVPGYYASKRALDRFGNAMAPELHARNIAIIGLHPGLVATELLAIYVAERGLDNSVAVPTSVPARMMVYFASCEDPWEYTGRLFWAEREMQALGLQPFPDHAEGNASA